jgi:tyrosyl-tRNA synthetase
MPLLIGTDGVEKMSKSLGNYISINDSPSEIYGRTMSIPDKLIISYYELTTDISPEELAGIKAQLNDPKANPRDLKRQLARKLVKMYHSDQDALEAEDEFEQVFVHKKIPDEVPEFTYPKGEIVVSKMLKDIGLMSSGSEAKRGIESGSVKINNEKFIEPLGKYNLNLPIIVQVGKRKFAKVIPK